MVSKIGVLCNQQDQSKYFAELVKHCVKKAKKRTLKNCNGETASGFTLLACRFTIQGMDIDSPLTFSECLKSPTNVSLLSLKAWITSLQLVILVASKAAKIIS